MLFDLFVILKIFFLFGNVSVRYKLELLKSRELVKILIVNQFKSVRIYADKIIFSRVTMKITSNSCLDLKVWSQIQVIL